MWCLEDYQVRYLRNKLTKCSLTVVCRRPEKIVCRSNSLCFFTVHAPTHVSLELCTFRCLVGHVFQRSGPVDRNMCATMVNMSQVIISPNLICKFHILGLTVLLSPFPIFVELESFFCFFPLFFRSVQICKIVQIFTFRKPLLASVPHLMSSKFFSF